MHIMNTNFGDILKSRANKYQFGAYVLLPIYNIEHELHQYSNNIDKFIIFIANKYIASIYLMI